MVTGIMKNRFGSRRNRSFLERLNENGATPAAGVVRRLSLHFTSNTLLKYDLSADLTVGVSGGVDVDIIHSVQQVLFSDSYSIYEESPGEFTRDAISCTRRSQAI